MAPVHGEWLGGRINGHTVIMRLIRNPHHRSDQFEAEIDGKVVADAAGLTRLHDLLRVQWPKAPSLRMLAGLRDGYSGRDEADAVACLDSD